MKRAQSSNKKVRKVSIGSYLFPLASILAIVLVPLTVYQHSGGGLVTSLPIWIHPHEMFLGVVLGLVAGYNLGQKSVAEAVFWIGLWLLGRMFIFTQGFGLASIFGMGLASLPSAIFGLALAIRLIPPFLKAKRWINRSLIAMFLLIAISSIGIILAIHYDTWPPLSKTAFLFTIVLVALMTFIAGRLLMPAVANELLKHSINLKHRLQAPYEQWPIILLSVLLITEIIKSLVVTVYYRSPVILDWLSIVIVFTVATLLLIRLYRWQIWRCWKRIDIVGLSVGYGWLSLGMMVWGVAWILSWPQNLVMHVVTIGALGSLSITVMIKQRGAKAIQMQQSLPELGIALVLIAVATVSRFYWQVGTDAGMQWLWLAAISWSLAYGLALFAIFRLQKIK